MITQPKVAEAYLSIKNSRAKAYDKKYYLQNNTEFEIELFNPNQFAICAEITINGNTEDYTLILQPGMRYFLDRFLGIDKKLKFETYEVEAGNTAVEKAIALNGVVQVNFYEEIKRTAPIKPVAFSKGRSGTGNIGGYPNRSYFSSQDIPTDNSNFSLFSMRSDVSNYNPDSFVTTTISTNQEQIINTVNYSDDFSQGTPISKTLDNVKETGRVQEGSQSNQEFKMSDAKFQTYAFNSVSFQILPFSDKPEDQEVAMYCCSCGRRSKMTEKFCPKCGSNLEMQRKNL